MSFEALSTTQEVYASTVFERVFKEFGLPLAIRTDNGVPFASPHALFGLSKLAVWWLRPGIGIRPSPRPYRGLNALHYPLHDRTITVTQCGCICFGRRKINLSTVLAGQNVGVKEVSDKIWLVSFMDYDLGFFDHETGRLGTRRTPSPQQCYRCVRNRP